jgi:hypothetical protein
VSAEVEEATADRVETAVAAVGAAVTGGGNSLPNLFKGEPATARLFSWQTSFID